MKPVRAMHAATGAAAHTGAHARADHGPAPEIAPAISVIVCTHARPRALARLLDSVAALRLPEGPEWELIVVDNDSRDDTESVARRAAARLPLRYVHEPRRGKSCALNRGVAAARGALIAFCDDDVVLDPEWLAALRRAADEAPEAAWFGARVLPRWPRGRPRWLSDECYPALAGFFAAYDLGEVDRAYRPSDRLPIGAGMAVRRALVEAVGGFREDLGPRGRQRGTGEDTDLIERARARGLRGRYVGRALAWHLIPEERLRLRAFVDYGIGKGINQHRLQAPGARRGSYLRIVEQTARALPQALRGRWDRVRVCAVNVGLEIGHRRAGREGRTP